MMLERETQKGIFILRNWHIIMGAGKSKMHRAGQQAGLSVRTDVEI